MASPDICVAALDTPRPFSLIHHPTCGEEVSHRYLRSCTPLLHLGWEAAALGVAKVTLLRQCLPSVIVIGLSESSQWVARNSLPSQPSLPSLQTPFPAPAQLGVNSRLRDVRSRPAGPVFRTSS